MSITQEQIKKIAKNLSKLPSNNDKLIGNIGNIIKYIDLLNEINTKGIKPTISVVEKGMPLRKDIKENKTIKAEDLIKCSNQKIIANQIIIPNIMK